MNYIAEMLRIQELFIYIQMEKQDSFQTKINKNQNGYSL